MISSLSELTDLQKEELVASLACLIAGQGEEELTAEKLQAVATSSGNSVSDGLAALYANVVSKSAKGITGFCPGVGGGGGGGGGAAAGGSADAPAAKEEAPEEEEAPPAVDMFGGGEKGGDY